MTDGVDYRGGFDSLVHALNRPFEALVVATSICQGKSNMKVSG
jgi:hypothetical protein